MLEQNAPAAVQEIYNDALNRSKSLSAGRVKFSDSKNTRKGRMTTQRKAYTNRVDAELHTAKEKMKLEVKKSYGKALGSGIGKGISNSIPLLAALPLASKVLAALDESED